MAKRGERRPWKVTYRYLESGIGGTVACSSEDQANDRAEQIRQAGASRHLEVTVKVARRA